jgi:hypothetical protein
MLSWIRRENRSRNRIIVLGIAFLLLISIPYAIGILLQGPDTVFGGFLVNPIDGNSYLAKMHEGWRGSWNFTLPYTIDPGRGTLLFIFYLALGHISKWLGTPLIVTYHCARILAAGFLFIVLIDFTYRLFPHGDRVHKTIFLTLFGSGSGWLIFLSGHLTSDFWVAEAYPFLSAYTNPHFPLGLGILLLCFSLALQPVTWKRFGLLALLSFLLAAIQPFGVVVGCMVLAGQLLWGWIETHSIEWKSFLSFLIGGAPLILYQYWITLHDPSLVVWNAQNLTPAPAVWDFLMSLSPALFLAVYAVWTIRKRTNSAEKLLIVWLIGSTLLTYFPFNLQRRFMTGIYVPAALLGGMGIEKLCERFPKFRREILWKIILPISLITNVLLILAGIMGIMAHSSSIFLSRGEYTAFQWINSNTSPDARILCSPESGLLIPAYTGRRVIYGHPFETVPAEENKAIVTRFFQNPDPVDSEMNGIQDQLINHFEVSFIFFGPREAQLGAPAGLDRFPVVYQADGVTIYGIQQKP